jgi:hypothetical protein
MGPIRKGLYSQGNPTPCEAKIAILGGLASQVRSICALFIGFRLLCMV